jgi:hypothetical protein
MSVITIAAKSYTIYGTVADAKDYLNGSIGAGYDEFNALVAGGAPNDDKIARLIIGGTRILERQKWQDAYNTFALRDAFISETIDAVAQYPFRKACYELAVAILADDSVQSTPTSGSNVQSVGAGPASVTFFRPTLGVTGRFPLIVMELIGAYMAGRTSSELGTTASYGTEEESQFDAADAFALDRSF